MALTKQNLAINFSGGQDTKTDPWQVSPNNFLAISNMVRNTLGRLTKRNGFGFLPELPSGNYTFLTTFNDDLTAIGEEFAAYSTAIKKWITKGQIQPLTLSVQSTIRNASPQIQCDSAVALNGLACTAYTENSGTVITYKYAVSDSQTGQNFIPPTVLSADSSFGTPRVFLFGNYFLIVYVADVSSVFVLNYIAINTLTLNVNAPVEIGGNLSVTSSTAFDGLVTNGNFYVAFESLSSGIQITYIDSNLFSHVLENVDNVNSGTYFSLCVDTSGSTPIVWLAYYDSVTLTAYAAAFGLRLNLVLAPTEIISGTIVQNLTATAQDSICSFYYEVKNSYLYDRTIPSNFIEAITLTQTGTLGTLEVIVRSVGLASKAFLLNEKAYFLTVYESPFQSTYFLVDGNGNVVLKIAYASAGGYYTTGLPSVSVQNEVIYVSYLFQDLITSVSKETNPVTGTQTSGVYSQTGINLATIEFGTENLRTAEIANNLHLTGGFLWMYDGSGPVEHNFHLWPDSIEIVGNPTVGNLSVQEYFYQLTYEWPDTQGNFHKSAPSIPVSYTIVAAPANFTANRTSGSPNLTSVSSFTGLQLGQAISGTGIPAGTFIQSISTGLNIIQMSQNASSGTATNTTVTPVTLTSLQINVPTARLTYKTDIKVVPYRWSAAQQVYYVVGGLGNLDPAISDPTVDSISIVDTFSDASILGNEILYTFGGEVEDTGSPACSDLTLFDTRLWLISSEDNELWYSQPVIAGVPVEMSQLLTYFVAPSIGSQGSTGKSRVIFPMDDKLIIFKANALYYINGTGPDLTGNNNQYSQPIFITATVGCSNPNSVVFIPNGLMFQSDKGIWLLGRDLSTSYIGAPMEAYNSANVLSAVAVPGTTQVRFMLDNGITLMYDYYTNEWGTFVGIPGIASTLYQNLHTFINSSGQVLQETPGLYYDGPNPTLIGFKSAWFNLAGLQGYQRIYWAFLLGEYLSPHKLIAGISYNYNPGITQQVTLSPDNYCPPYAGDTVYAGPPDLAYGGISSVDPWQINFEHQQCQSVQLTIQEVYDSTIGPRAGAGLTLSGIDLVYGASKAYPRRLPASRKTG